MHKVLPVSQFANFLPRLHSKSVDDCPYIFVNSSLFCTGCRRSRNTFLYDNPQLVKNVQFLLGQDPETHEMTQKSGKVKTKCRTRPSSGESEVRATTDK